MVTNASRASFNDLGINPDGSVVNPAAFQQQIRQDSNTMAQLLQRDPLAQAILGNDLDELQNVLKERHVQRLEFQKQQEEGMALMYADPFDVEAQRKIEAAIRQKGIDESWEAALEHNPEAFARVVMLYLDMEVNGVPLKAFVDSGAQTAIISKNCAEHWGLLRLLAQWFKGIARGVGQSEILGKIHVAPIKCMIDLKENVLRVGEGEVVVPFLQEKDMPSRFLDEERVTDEVAQSSAQCLDNFPCVGNIRSEKKG